MEQIMQKMVERLLAKMKAVLKAQIGSLASRMDVKQAKTEIIIEEMKANKNT
jgi:hypothetical protein